jgi:hypothetical protein
MKTLAKMFDALASKGQTLMAKMASVYTGWKKKHEPELASDNESLSPTPHTDSFDELTPSQH